MDIEKFAGGKLFMFCEWAFKLTIWNLLTLLIIAIATIIPFYLFYNVQDDYVINNVEVVNEEVIVTLNNEEKHNIGKFISNYNVKEFDFDDDFIYITIEDLYITYSNADRLKSIEEVYFNENNELIVNGMHKTFNYGNIFDSPISIEFCKIDINKNVIIGLENGLTFNYGPKIETNGTLAGILIIIAIVIGIFVFIPAYVTLFSMIKILATDGSAPLSLYFEILWDNFKSIYKVELIFIPISVVMSYLIYLYYMILTYSEFENKVLIGLSYNILLVFVLIFILWLVSLPMTLGYFRMRTKTIIKFTFIMAFKNILFTLLYVFINILPLLLCFINSFFIPIWFLLGFSVPLYVIYRLSAKKYRALVNDFESYKDDDIYDLKEDN